MKYPEILGHNIELLPAKYRSSEWFESLPQKVHVQFYWTVKKYNLEVAAEYLNDNHGCDDSQGWHPTKKRVSKFGDVNGFVYAKNKFKFIFPDGPYYYCTKNNSLQWRFVGYVDVGEIRIVRASRDSGYVRTKLNLAIAKAVKSGISRLGISEPLIFNLTLKVAEDLREGAA